MWRIQLIRCRHHVELPHSKAQTLTVYGLTHQVDDFTIEFEYFELKFITVEIDSQLTKLT